MKFMIVMYSDPAATKTMSAGDQDAVARTHQALVAELTTSGELLNGAGLAYPEQTRTLQRRGDTTVSRTGSYLSADNHVSAYYVLECASLDRALAVAERVLDFHVTVVEVRAIHDSVGM